MSDLREGMPSVEAVQDPEARRILQHVLQNMQVRAGNLGDGENAYVTRKDLRDTGVSIARFGDNARPTGANATPESVRDRLESLLGTDIQSIQDAIASSPSYQVLGNPIAAIGSGAQIAEIRRTMNNSFASFAQLSTTLQAQIGTQRVSILQNAEAVADLDGKASAQWYVKTDINGAVSGFGLFSTGRNGVVSSEFYVRADRFAIGAPGVPRLQNPDGSYQAASPTEVPFVVFTTQQTINGKVVLPGVYMRRTFIHDGAIQNAMIGAAAINTLEIAGDAVTVPSGSTQSGSLLLTSSYQFVTSLSLVYQGIAPAKTLFLITGYASGNGSGTSPFSVNIQLRINGSPVRTTADSLNNDWGTTPTMTYIATGLGVGTHTIEVYARTQQSGTNANIVNTDLISIGLKR